MTSHEILEIIEQLEDNIRLGRELLKTQETIEQLRHEVIIAENRAFLCRLMLIESQCYHDKGNIQQSIPVAEQALDISIEIGDKFLQSRSYNCAGMCYMNIGNFTKAIDCFQNAIAINQELNLHTHLALATMNIGNVYNKIVEHEKALEYFLNGLQICEELHLESYIPIVMGNIGLSYMYLKNYSKAIEFLHKSLIRSEDLHLEVQVVAASINLGNIYLLLEEYEQAMNYCQKALHDSEKLDMNLHKATVLGNIGKIFNIPTYSGCNREKAEVYLLEGLRLSEECNFKSVESEFHQVLSELYEVQEQWEKSLFHYKKFHSIQQKLQLEETKKLADTFDFERKNIEREKQIAIERSRFQEREQILKNILPEEITTRLIRGEKPIADHFESVSILFMDIVNFTTLSSKIAPQQLVYLLNSIFTTADNVIRRCGLEKIKTIGDAYMAVAGAPVKDLQHSVHAARAALLLMQEMKDLVVEFPEQLGDNQWTKNFPELAVRIGLHCGSAVAGVVGENKFLYDLWGDAVNTASRMESYSEAGKIQISEYFYRQLAMHNASEFSFIERGEIEIKGKGKMKTYFLLPN